MGVLVTGVQTCALPIYEISLATETIITALKLQRDALAIQSSRRRARFGSMLLLMIPVFFVGLMIGASYGIDEGRAREREALKYPMILQLSVDSGRLKTDRRYSGGSCHRFRSLVRLCPHEAR